MGELEELVLLIVAVMNGQGYSIGIIGELSQRTGRNIAIGAVQTVLKRMEDKGWVVSEWGEATKERGGKRKRYYSITAQGQQLLAQNRAQRNNLWNAIIKIEGKYGTA